MRDSSATGHTTHNPDSATLAWRLREAAGMLATSHARVLVADDQQDVVAALRMLLRGAGLEVDPATSVQEVRHRLDSQTYDLVLMDLNYARDTTSGREGLDLLAEIHQRDRLLPVIVMTGWGSIDTAVEAMRRGARTFVHKPWDNHTLTETVCREIEEGHAQRQSDKLAATEQADAQAIQRALLPATLPSVSGVGLAARWEPAKAFGGDCYDALRLTDTHLAISIADVCGKGLPAALLMSNLLASLRAFAASERSPREVVTSVNRALCRQKDLRRFVTLFYALYDSTTRVLSYTNAGHNPPLVLRRDGSCERLATGGTVTGIFDEGTFEEGRVTLDPGDRLVLYTDGITEARSANGDGDEFDDAGLLQTLARCRHLDAQSIVDAVFDDVGAFAGGRLQDDATAVVATIE
jgi:sigma-B regulation protein RsbU (phosphoserine phosphatase)